MSTHHKKSSRPCIIILAAPSGSGKTSLARELMAALPSIFFSVSATTRTARSHEKTGVHYHFMKLSEFKSALAADELLEYEEVYPDCFYGTLRSVVMRSSSRAPVLLDIDVVGALNVKREFGEDCLALFVRAPSLDELGERLKARGTESEESLKVRIDKAAYELSFSDQFDRVLVNDDLSRATTELIEMVTAFVKRSEE